MAEPRFRLQDQRLAVQQKRIKLRPDTLSPQPRSACCDAIFAEKDVLIHVSPTGNDKAAGTAGEPLRTFPEAVRRLRPLWRRRQQILLQPGEYTITDEVFDVYVGRQVGAESEPLTIRGGFTQQGETGTVAAASADTVKAVASLGAPDELAGARLRFVDGGAGGDAYLIVGNTNDTVRVAGGLNRAPGVGAHFVIERPNVTIVHRGFLSFDGTGRTGIVFEGVRFRANPNGPMNQRAFELSGNMEAYAAGCEWDLQGGIFQVVDTCMLHSGRTPLSPFPGGNDGCFVHDGQGWLGFRTSLGSVFGHWYLRDIGVTAEGAGIIGMSSLTARRARVTVDGTYGAVTFEAVGATLRDAPAAGFAVSGPGASLSLHGATIEGAAGDAITVDERAYARLSGVTGTGNAGAGVRLGDGVRVVADKATTVTGSIDVVVKGKTATWLELDAAGGIGDAEVFSRIDRGA